jgi:gas vesicle protein
MGNNNGSGGFVLGLFVGAVIGGMAGLLLAPKPGAQTRADLLEMGDAWRTRADEIAAQMAAEMRARGVPDMSAVGDRVGPAVDSLRERVSTTLGAGSEAGTGAVASARQGVGAVGTRTRMAAGSDSDQSEEGTAQKNLDN